MNQLPRSLLLTSMLLFTAAGVIAQSAQIEDIHVTANETVVSVEVDLNDSVTPTVTFARNPDRMVVDFPNTRPGQVSQRVSVQKDGVERVRVGLNHASPPMTRVVVDVDVLRPFTIQPAGSKFVLNILTSGEPLERDSETDSDNREERGISELPAETIASNAAPREVRPGGLPAGISAVKATLPSRLGFRIKAISSDSVYIDGGSNAGLQSGMKLMVRDSAPGSQSPADEGSSVAELRIIAVATTSSVAEVHGAKRPLKRGDWAELIPADAEKAQAARTTKALAAVHVPPGRTFLPDRAGRPSSTERDDSDAPRLQGRIGFDYSGISSSGSTPGYSKQVGISFQSDMTHLFGTHWNLEGYWRGRITQHSAFQEETIQETLNKTYTMQLYYDNPDSPWVAGFGRMYLPWAVSLDTIDGGYFGRKLGSGVTAGVFMGSTPDLTSWDYQPDHQISGSFVNFTEGSYDGFHLSSTSGLALSMIDWRLDRPYLFFENEASYKNFINVFHSLIADSPRGLSTDGIRPGSGISRSYLTIHIQPSARLSFDIYHNYFRDVPTAATRIVGTGLVDKLLFQGVNAGVHFEPVRHVTAYTMFGRSEKTGDAHRSWNQMYGLTWSEILHTGIRTDFHYSKFDSNFGRGEYRLLSLSRQLSNRTFWNVQFGTQNMTSPFTADNESKFVASSMDVNLGKHSFLQSGYTFVNGSALNYREWYTSWGYRFDGGQGEMNHNPITK
jgi:hypothetical protein